MNKDRLIKLLGMLGSDYEGERGNAALMIAKMASDDKLTVVQLMEEAFGSRVTTSNGVRGFNRSWYEEMPRGRKRDLRDDLEQDDEINDIRPAPGSLMGRMFRLRDRGDLSLQWQESVNQLCAGYPRDEFLSPAMRKQVEGILRRLNG